MYKVKGTYLVMAFWLAQSGGGTGRKCACVSVCVCSGLSLSSYKATRIQLKGLHTDDLI